MSQDAGDDDNVGYRKPPVRARFQPGQSGNPKGRAKGRRNLATSVRKALRTPVKLTERGKTRWASGEEGVLLRLREKALNGDARAIEQYLKLMKMYETDPADATSEVTDADDQAILEAYREEIAVEERAKLIAAATTESEDLK